MDRLVFMYVVSISYLTVVTGSAGSTSSSWSCWPSWSSSCWTGTAKATGLSTRWVWVVVLGVWTPGFCANLSKMHCTHLLFRLIADPRALVCAGRVHCLFRVSRRHALWQGPDGEWAAHATPQPGSSLSPGAHRQAQGGGEAESRQARGGGHGARSGTRAAEAAPVQ